MDHSVTYSESSGNDAVVGYEAASAGADCNSTEQLVPLVPLVPELKELGIEQKELNSLKPEEISSICCGLSQLHFDSSNASEETMLPQDSFSLLVTSPIRRPLNRDGAFLGVGFTFLLSSLVLAFQLCLLCMLLVG